MWQWSKRFFTMTSLTSMTTLPKACIYKAVENPFIKAYAVFIKPHIDIESKITVVLKCYGFVTISVGPTWCITMLYNTLQCHHNYFKCQYPVISTIIRHYEGFIYLHESVQYHADLLLKCYYRFSITWVQDYKSIYAFTTMSVITVFFASER